VSGGGGRRPVVAVGAHVVFEGRSWQVVALEGPVVRLVDERGLVASMLVGYLCAAPDFALVGAAAVAGVPQWGLFQTVPVRERERALAWQRHIHEIECGLPDGPGGAGVARAQYGPGRSMAERERAKVEEMRASGWAVSVATVQRMRGRYRRQGLWGLVDKRVTRGARATGRSDERVVVAVLEALRRQRGRSKGTVEGLRRLAGEILEQAHGPGVVALPSRATFYRLVNALADPAELPGRAARTASATMPPFASVGASRPGEQVQVDTTRLDVMAVLDDGRLGRPELTIAVDVATRSIVAAVLRPEGTKAVDAALLLAEMAVPHPMRPHWPEALELSRASVPYERLATIDGRLEGVAARPVIVPETIVVDRGRVFVSEAFLAACETLGVSVQPAPPRRPAAKGVVERTFGAINTLFCQHVAGYTGSNTTLRGQGVEDEACWTVPQLQELLDEWITVGWQGRPHEGLRHPMMARAALTPNEMWGALVGACGYVPVPLAGRDYVELLPVRWHRVTDRGIRIDHRTYDHPVLEACRGRSSGVVARQGKWEVHHNPHDGRRVWVRLPGGEFAEVPWIHRDHVNAPFDVHAWRHVRESVERRGDRERHEADLADALAVLLREVRPAVGPARGRSREREGTASDRAAGGARRVVGQAGTGHDGHAANPEGVTGLVFPGRVPGATAHDGAGVGAESLDDLDGGGEFLDEDAHSESETGSGGVFGGAGGFGLYDAHAEAELW
jgi:transposase InsO family protein